VRNAEPWLSHLSGASHDIMPFLGVTHISLEQTLRAARRSDTGGRTGVVHETGMDNPEAKETELSS
jgi:hypothetical protein